MPKNSGISEYAGPVVVENLDFGKKKEKLREEGKKYSRMLSSWAYNQFCQKLEGILSNRGIELIKVNPAYSSLIGLVKYARMYGLASDEAAALVIARRGMRLSLPTTALLNRLSSREERKARLERVEQIK